MAEKFKKILITGPGRSGTTLLMRILIALGFDTDFEKDSYFDPVSKGGLEVDLYNDLHSTLICKSPYYSEKIEKIQGWYEVLLVLVPIRKLSQTAASRARIGPNAWGGLWKATNQEEQEVFNARLFYELIENCVRLEMNLKFIHFPRLAEEPDYLWKYVEEISQLAGHPVSKDQFEAVFREVVDTSEITQYE